MRHFSKALSLSINLLFLKSDIVYAQYSISFYISIFITGTETAQMIEFQFPQVVNLLHIFMSFSYMANFFLLSTTLEYCGFFSKISVGKIPTGISLSDLSQDFMEKSLRKLWLVLVSRSIPLVGFIIHTSGIPVYSMYLLWLLNTTHSVLKYEKVKFDEASHS